MDALSIFYQNVYTSLHHLYYKICHIHLYRGISRRWDLGTQSGTIKKMKRGLPLCCSQIYKTLQSNEDIASAHQKFGK